MKLSLSIVTALAVSVCSNSHAPKNSQKTAPESKHFAETEFTSEYTDLTKVDCTTVEMDEEGAGFVREQCGEVKGVPLFRVESDLRQSAYAGNEPTGRTTILPFNNLTNMVEWRLQDSKPIALIYRLRANSPDMPGHGKTQLFIQKIGVGDDKGCIIGVVAGNYVKANSVARAIADTAEDRDCNNEAAPSEFGKLM
jgi:hypothetical protein